MSIRRLEKRPLTRWMFAAVAVCAGVPALMTVGCSKAPSPPGVAPSAMANKPCATSPKAHPYVVNCDDQGEPLGIVAPKQRLHVKRGESVLFVNPSARRVMVKAKAEFRVFTEGDEVILEPRESTCRTISKAVAGPFPRSVALEATYQAPPPPLGQPVPMAVTGEEAQPAGAAPKPPSSGIIEPLGGPGMDIDG
jgi:hypothetical protein